MLRVTTTNETSQSRPAERAPRPQRLETHNYERGDGDNE